MLSFLMGGLLQPIFGFIFPFSWYIVRLPLTNFTIVIDDRNWERRRKRMPCSTIASYLEKAQSPARIDGEQSEQKTPKSVPGFKLDPLGQNAIAPLLAPPPPHLYNVKLKIIIFLDLRCLPSIPIGSDRLMVLRSSGSPMTDWVTSHRYL